MSRRRRKKIDDLAIMVVVGGSIYAIFQQKMALPFWILLGIATLGAWVLLFMPTRCDFTTSKNKLCPNSVRGKFRGCYWHGREKRDAVFAMFNLRNPGQVFRIAWSTREPTTAIHPGTGETLTVSRRTAYEAIMLACTIISAVAGIAGTTFTAVGALQA